MAKKNKPSDDTVVHQPKFTKGQLMGSKRFNFDRDAVMASLSENKTYTMEQASSIVLDFLNRKV